jgi:2-phosphosulfolactate phosphatase
LVGAGAIISHLNDLPSPEAQVAISAYRQAEPDLKNLLRQCSSGQELIGRGFEADVDLAAALNVSDCVPTLRDRSYTHVVDSD